VGLEKTFEWFTYSGQSVCWCERRNDEYLYVFPRHARYHVAADGVITCLPQAGTRPQMLRHLLLNQIIPRYLATHGRLVLHASAVTLENGHSVAFLGNTGFGKSTLAASFYRHGADLIDDDTILLQPGDDGVTAIGGYAGIRLFPDSMHAVFDEAGEFSRYTPYSDKQQLLLQRELGGPQARPRVLDALFLLDDPGDERRKIEPGAPVCIEPVPGGTAMMAMIYCAFALDPADQRLIVRNFRNIGQSISERLDLYSLRYPRDHARLPEVRRAVMERVAVG